MSLPQSEDQLRQLAVDEVGRKLLHAAELIRERGWCQGHFESDDGRMCTLGAVRKALGMPLVSILLDSPESMRLHLYLSGNVVNWNDAPGRTAEQVIAALTAAALRTGE